MSNKQKVKCKYCPNFYWMGRVREQKATFHCKLKPQYFIDRFTREPKWCPLNNEPKEE